MTEPRPPIFDRFEATVAAAARRVVDEGVLALDVGTSTSCAVLVDGDRVRQVKEPAGDSWAWPSVAAWDGTALRVGTWAERRRRARPSAVRSEFKRDLGTTTPLLLGDSEHLPEDLTAALIGAMKAEAERLHGKPLARAVVTCPATYGPGDPRRALLLGAAEAAGFDAVDLLLEPVAAAQAPLAGAPFAAGDIVLVYDFGGGTFDAAVVRIAANGHHEVLGHAALEDCGGADVDVLLYDEVVRLGGQKLADWLTVGADDDPAAQTARLRNQLELADFVRRTVKHRLSVEDVDDYFPPADVPIELSADRLAELVRPLVDRTVDCCRDLYDRSGAERLTAVLLVGGSTRIPSVVAALRERLGQHGAAIRTVEDADLAVAQGAAAWAQLSSDRFSRSQRPSADGTPLRWELPGGPATLLRWNVATGAEFAAGDALGLVRLTTGQLWELVASEGGVLRQQHAEPGDQVVSGDWLVTTGTPAPPVHRPAEPAAPRRNPIDEWRRRQGI